MILDMTDTKLCDTCVYFIAYGTTGDASTRCEPSENQRQTDLDHAALMFNRLGVQAVGFEPPDDADGSFSWSGCEGCGATGLHVYTGTLIYEGVNDHPRDD